MELMVVDALCKANAELGIADSIQRPSEFWKVEELYHLVFIHDGFLYHNTNAI